MEKIKNKQSGFFQLLAIIIIVIILLAIAGYDAQAIWDSMIKPIIEFFFNLIIKIFDIVVKILTKAIDVFMK